MNPSVQPRSARRRGVLAAATRLLAAHGMAAAEDVLTLVVDALDCDAIALRGSGVRVEARRRGSLGVVPVQPREGRWFLDVPARSGGTARAVLTVVARRPFTADDAGVLAAVADVFALALGQTDAEPPAGEPAHAVLDAEADRAQVAAALHERIGHSLVALRYTADLVAAGLAAPGELEQPARAALETLRQIQRDSRAHALESGLRSALHEVVARAAADRPDDGHPMLRATVDADDPRLDELPPALAVVVERVAEAALRGATGRAHVRVNMVGATVKLVAESADNEYDASELARWTRRATALGGDLRFGPEGVELILPAVPLAEGSHDDSPDL